MSGGEEHHEPDPNQADRVPVETRPSANPAGHPGGELARRWRLDDEARAQGIADGTIAAMPPPDLASNWRSDVTEVGLDRLRGLVIGSAVGDALGAPFEFGPSGAFTARFPTRPSAADGVNEMIGSSLWEPGEFTDDTQMAILEAESLVACGGIDEADLFDRFRRWADSGPKDVGVMTSSVLSHPDHRRAAADYFGANPRGAAGNGSLMRAGFAAARWMFGRTSGTVSVARRLSRVTHADPAAQEGRALFHLLCHTIFYTGAWPRDVEPLIACLHPDHRDTYRALLGDDPPRAMGNGTVWGCLRDAALAVRDSTDFEGAMRRALDVGNDVDTVAAVAGALAGVRYGLGAIPTRWVEPLHGTVLGRRYDASDLVELYDRLRLAHFEP